MGDSSKKNTGDSSDLDRALQDLVQQIAAEPVSDRIKELAARLQTAVDGLNADKNTKN